jgi:hypothetical protein
MQERLAAEAVLAAFCTGNPAGQAQLASTLTPSSKSGVAAFTTAAHVFMRYCLVAIGLQPSCRHHR